MTEWIVEPIALFAGLSTCALVTGLFRLSVAGNIGPGRARPGDAIVGTVLTAIAGAFSLIMIHLIFQIH